MIYSEGVQEMCESVEKPWEAINERNFKLAINQLSKGYPVDEVADNLECSFELVERAQRELLRHPHNLANNA